VKLGLNVTGSNSVVTYNAVRYEAVSLGKMSLFKVKMELATIICYEVIFQRGFPLLSGSMFALLVVI
jgi:hypothetical protein